MIFACRPLPIYQPAPATAPVHPARPRAGSAAAHRPRRLWPQHPGEPCAYGIHHCFLLNNVSRILVSKAPQARAICANWGGPPPPLAAATHACAETALAPPGAGPGRDDGALVAGGRGLGAARLFVSGQLRGRHARRPRPRPPRPDRVPGGSVAPARCVFLFPASQPSPRAAAPPHGHGAEGGAPRGAAASRLWSSRPATQPMRSRCSTSWTPGGLSSCTACSSTPAARAPSPRAPAPPRQRAVPAAASSCSSSACTPRAETPFAGALPQCSRRART